MPDPHKGTRTGGTASVITTAAVKLFRRYTGRGPTKARFSVDGDLAMIVLRNTLAPSELELARAGKGEQVLTLRHAAQEAMRDELVALIEDNLGRRVEAFSSHNSI